LAFASGLAFLDCPSKKLAILFFSDDVDTDHLAILTAIFPVKSRRVVTTPKKSFALDMASSIALGFLSR
jgi:hypothetical protein